MLLLPNAFSRRSLAAIGMLSLGFA
jgi:hypothetical protein